VAEGWSLETRELQHASRVIISERWGERTLFKTQAQQRLHYFAPAALLSTLIPGVEDTNFTLDISSRSCVIQRAGSGSQPTMLHTCACWFMVAPCTHLLGSCDPDRQAKEICRHAECARTALIASNALATGS